MVAEPDAGISVSSGRNGYYIRADLGVPDYDFSDFAQGDLTTNGGNFLSESIGSRPVVGLGFGRQLAPWLRVDLTAEYRLPAHIDGVDNLSGVVVGSGEIFQANTSYAGKLSSAVGLANVYFDLPNWRGFTPFIGGGIGFAHNEISSLTTSTYGSLTDPHTGAVVGQATSATSPELATWDLAWALMAGASFDLTESAKIEFGYRYIDLGGGLSGSSGLLFCHCGTIGQPLEVNDLHAHEFRIGMRFMFDAPGVVDRPAPLK